MKYFIFIFIAIAIISCGENSVDTNKCIDVNCDSWQLCNAETGLCELQNNMCKNSDDCLAGYSCTDNKCVVSNECFTNTDCTDNAKPICTNGVCVEELTNECFTNVDCTDNAKPICVDAICVAEVINKCADINCENWELCNSETGLCEFKNNMCNDSDDCLVGYTCNSNKCEHIANCTINDDCTENGSPLCDNGICIAECQTTADCTDKICSSGLCVDEIQICENGESIKIVEESFYNYVKTTPYALENDEKYIVPTVTYRENFSTAIRYFIAGDFCEAQNFAKNADMIIFKIIDTDISYSKDFTNEYYCMKGKIEADGQYDPSTYRGIYCVRNYLETNTYTREVHIAIPHPLFDGNTNLEGAQVFRDTNARYYSLSTTDRRSNDAQSSCDTHYKLSDMAHNINSLFHAFTKKVQDLDLSVYHIQFHGYDAGDGSDVAITSVGSKANYNSDRPIRIFTKNLKLEIAKYEIENNDSPNSEVIGCNDAADNALERLCSLGNMQGRYINGSTTNTCETDPTSFVNSRFIHIEASRWLRGKWITRPSHEGYIVPKFEIMSNTINSTFNPVRILSSH